ncbi:MAG: hypothetical protein COA99_16150, partial [Moraxellaceae bacterium]
ALRQYSPRFIASTKNVTSQWKNGATINLYDEFQKITFDALIAATFGTLNTPESTDTDGEELRDALIMFVNSQLTNGMFFASILFGEHIYNLISSKTNQAKLALENNETMKQRGLFTQRANNLALAEHHIAKIIQHRRNSPTGTYDILSALVEDDDLNDDEISQQLLTLLIAGHDTTSLALSWAFQQIMERPKLLQRLLQELDPLTEDQIVEGASTPLLMATIYESLRYTPGATAVPRRLDYDVEIDGIQVPAGTVIALNVVGAHFRKETWGDPETFRPERFLDREPDNTEFLPFGGGIRRCLGDAFALSEMRNVLAFTLKHWSLTPIKGYKARPIIHGFLVGPHRPVKAQVQKR